ncbi:hypothetical protein EJV47_02795 [Hymenobacter gummosus]|uniref:Outer membrane protein beta-barrel domain-containing protein n=1 Tax=Hymenobacter gummosus TaxID=1776032 RepID=A0A431U8Y1_9BACT|nr:hypothetical protein [Hymenobacter gummosus]RTQ53681.1 hypothetical protein EJV47_02795 [Hymenobacter gummosus]
MRKTLLLLAALGAALPTLAQTERGTTLLGLTGGSLEFSRRDSYRNTSIALHPTLGRFLADNLVLGAAVDLEYYRFRSGSNAFQRAFGYGISPFVRYYVVGQGRHQVFAEVGSNLTWYKVRNENVPPFGSTSRYTSRVLGYHGALGYNFFLTPTAALEASAGYRRYGKDDVSNRRGELDVRLGFSMFLPAKAAN